MTTRVCAAVAMLHAFFCSTAHAGDPPAPAGRDPGGRAVAIIGAGVDYTKDTIASRLARDGEGEIIGYDVVDDDRRPFASGDQSDTVAAEIILGEGQATKLIALRADPSSWRSVGKAIALAGAMPAKTVLLLCPLDADKMSDLIQSAAKQFSQKLFIAPASGTAGLAGQANVILVALIGGPTGLQADLAAPVDNGAATPSLSAARIAALSARLEAVEPDLSPAAMKARILDLAETGAQGRVITQPRRHFWLE